MRKSYIKLFNCVIILFLVFITIPVLASPSGHFIYQEFSNLNFRREKVQDCFIYKISFNINNFSAESKNYEIQFELSNNNSKSSELFNLSMINLSHDECKDMNFQIESTLQYDSISLFSIEGNVRIKQCSYQIKKNNTNTYTTKLILYILLGILFILTIFFISYKKTIKQTFLKLMGFITVLFFFAVCMILSILENSYLATILSLSTFTINPICENFNNKFHYTHNNN